MNILVTGGTGHLGRATVEHLKRDGQRVRLLARHPAEDPDVEWVHGDLSTGEGVEAAFRDMDTVIHAATNSPVARRGAFRPLDFVRSPTDVDVAGTGALLQAAEAAAVAHFVHVSIVGLEHMARVSPYARVKLRAEELVRASNVPWSIVRATSFFWLFDRMLAKMARRPIMLLPADVHVEPVDSDDFAGFLAASAVDGRRGAREDFAGPEALTMRELAEQYLAARGLRKKIWNLPLPHRATSALEAGSTSASAIRGEKTWSTWLRESTEASSETMSPVA